MRRFQLFEFNEASWLPARIRALITDYLICLTGVTRAFYVRLPMLAEALRHAASPDRVIDLCSGSGGAWLHMAERLNRMFPHDVEVVLTDLYLIDRNLAAAGSSKRLRLHAKPIDATDPSHQLEGLQTVFNAFHQFPPEQAQQILARAVAQNQPIVVMELLQRRWIMLPLLLLTPLMVWVLTPFIRPFRWSRLLLTYLVPLAPVLITWDSLISWLRCYRPDELLAMTKPLDAPHYHWEAGSYWYRAAPVTYLVGYPVVEPGLSAAETAAAAAAPAVPRSGR